MTRFHPATGLPPGATLRPEHEVSPGQAAAMLREPAGYLVLDCRLPEEFEAARVEGSVPIPLHELESRLDEVEEALGERGGDKAAPFAVLCHHGHRSLRAALLLQQHGFTGARSVYGGIELWACAVDGSIPRYERQGSKCTIVPR
ncbi:MAG TPA: rhodanese-like domain-containing protein [Phycisphaerales bacterium]|nr:rhodanese-like domain-containing protein [Phycisphaerales bacterium]